MIKKAIKCAVFAIVVAAAGAGANPVATGFWIYADANGYEGSIRDDYMGLLPLYVVPWGPQMSAVQFVARKPDCFNAVYIGESSPYPVVIGDSQTGVAIGYGTCMTTPTCILVINYFAQGTTSDCCWYPVEASMGDPLAIPGYITYADCSDPPERGYLKAGASIINEAPGGCPTPVKQSTWGQVKALYGP